MGYVPVQCPHCHSSEVIKAGKQANGTQHHQCQNEQCDRQIFLLHYQDRGRAPEIRRHVIDMAINGSGIRDAARVLRISPTTVIAILKKPTVLQHVNLALLPPLCSRAIRVSAGRAAELDELWSFVGAKATARWLWHAVDHHTGRVLANVVGTRKDAVSLKLKAFLTSFGITRYDTDKTSVFRRHLPPAQHTVGKRTKQKIERPHLTLRTRLKRLARQTLCFSVHVSSTICSSGYICTGLSLPLRSEWKQRPKWNIPIPALHPHHWSLNSSCFFAKNSSNCPFSSSVRSSGLACPA